MRGAARRFSASASVAGAAWAFGAAKGKQTTIERNEIPQFYSVIADANAGVAVAAKANALDPHANVIKNYDILIAVEQKHSRIRRF